MKNKKEIIEEIKGMLIDIKIQKDDYELTEYYIKTIFELLDKLID